MGLFGNLFDKKVCAICGGDIGLLGNRKLEDGNLCKNCASQLSPWFSDRRHSTVSEISLQLQYRAANRQRAMQFVATRVYGAGNMRLFIDDNMGCFTVASSTDFVRSNPDIIDFGMLTACVPNIRDSRWEVRGKGPDGHDVSFRPPRYRYEYDFGVRLGINSPWFDEIFIDLCPGTVREEEWERCMSFLSMTEDVVEVMTGVRPDLSGRIPYNPPFCHRCGADLAPDGCCPYCDRVGVPPIGAFAGAAFAGGMRQAPPPAHGAPMQDRAPAPQPGRTGAAPMPERRGPSIGMPSGGPAPAQSRTAPGNVPSQSRPMPGPAPSQSRTTPGTAPSQNRPAPGATPFQSRTAPGNAPSQARPMPGPAPSQSRTAPGPAPSQGRTAPGPAPSQSRTAPGNASSQGRPMPGAAPSQGRTAPSQGRPTPGAAPSQSRPTPGPSSGPNRSGNGPVGGGRKR